MEDDLKKKYKNGRRPQLFFLNGKRHKKNGRRHKKKSQDPDVAAIDIYLKYSKIKDTTIVSCVGVVIYTLLNYIHNSY